VDNDNDTIIQLENEAKNIAPAPPASRGKTMPIIGIILTSILVLAAGVGVAKLLIKLRVSPSTKSEEPATPTVRAEPLVAATGHVVTISGYGSAQAKVRVQISPQVSGIIKSKGKNFLTGKSVAKDEILLEIDKTDYQQNFETASNNVKLLQAQHDKLLVEKTNLEKIEKIEKDSFALAGKQLVDAKDLMEAGAGSKEDIDGKLDAKLRAQRSWQTAANQLALIAPRLDELSSRRQLASVEVARAQTALDRTVLKSPIDGIVQACTVEEGDKVAPGSTCGEVYAREIVEIPVSIDTAELQWLDAEKLALCRQGGKVVAGKEIFVTVILDRDEEKENPQKWTGTLARIAPSLDEKTRTALLIIEVTKEANPSINHLPLSNDYCKVTITGRTLAEVYILDRHAILMDRNVYVLEKQDDGKVLESFKLAKKPVIIARYIPGKVMILPGKGLEAGDRVATGTIAMPVVGMEISPRVKKAKSADKDGADK